MAFPTDWSYRRKITISGSAGAGVGYQVFLKIGESSGSSDFDFHLDNKSAKFPSQQDDSGDFRFTLDDGTTLLPFWVEKVEGTSPNRTAHIWVKVSADLSTDQSIYIYFGNASAENVSDSEATFIREIDGLVGSWNLDEGSGGVIHDTSGNGNEGTIYGATWVDGKYGKALDFDGSNDYVEIPFDMSQLVENKALSVEMWVRWKGVTKWGKAISTDFRQDGNWGYPWVFFNISQRDNTGRWSAFTAVVRKTNDDLVTYTDDTGVPIKIDKWAHIVGRTWIENTTAYHELWQDGEKIWDTTTTDVADYDYGNSDRIFLGVRSAFSKDEWGKGTFDEIRLYNRALTQEEILDLRDNYGYTTADYPGKVLVRKWSDPEPTFSSVDNIESLYTLQGTVCDKNGNPITGTTVKIFLLDKDTGELSQATTSNSEDGSWSANFWSASPKTLAVFALEGTYGEDTDIAGAEFLETE